MAQPVQHPPALPEEESFVRFGRFGTSDQLMQRTQLRNLTLRHWAAGNMLLNRPAIALVKLAVEITFNQGM